MGESEPEETGQSALRTGRERGKSGGETGFCGHMPPRVQWAGQLRGGRSALPVSGSWSGAQRGAPGSSGQAGEDGAVCAGRAPPPQRRSGQRAAGSGRGGSGACHTMFPFCSCWSTRLLLLLLLAVALKESWQTEEKTCDLVGEKDKESKKELALVNRLEPLFNKSFESTVGQGSDTYIYIFRVCREASNHSSGAGLVQINKSNGKETVVGRINETHIFNGSNWIMLIYKGGDEYDNHCGKEQRRAVVMISCSRHTLAGSFTPVSEERGKVQDCFYLFEMDSSLACSPEVSHLSVGSILLVTLVSLVAVYIIGGFLYQRLVVGAKGMEQFPHLAFWQDLGNLVADGCDFVCRSKPRNVPAAYRGVGDDQLGEESEERDDHLLPM